MSLAVNSQPEAERVDTSEEIKLGDWYWLSTTEDDLDDEGNKIYDEEPLDETDSDFESPFDDAPRLPEVGAVAALARRQGRAEVEGVARRWRPHRARSADGGRR